MRAIPPLLQQHMKQDATTLCQLIKIRAKDGTTIGLTTLDKSIAYDDGTGLLIYNAPVGFQPATILEAQGFEVGNTEFESLVSPEYDLDMDEFEVNSGKWDYAQYFMYKVNYEDLSMGHYVVMNGYLGQMKTYDGLQLFGEMRSIADLFRRNVVDLYSISCRAIFGSQEGEERQPCLFNAESLWIAGEVTSVDLENTRVFTDSSKTQEGGHFWPGLVQFLTGSNAGLYVEIESFEEGGKISLSYETNYAINVGDTFRIRRDCNKQARDEVRGCKSHYGNEWPLRFRGEPDIPIGDLGTMTTPSIGGNVIGSIAEQEDGGE